MTTRFNTSFADQGYYGSAVNGQANSGQRGIPFTPVTAVNFGAISTADADGACASQTVTGAGTAFAIDGALATGGVATFTTPRNVVGAWTNTAIITITGKDQYGVTMSEVSASGTSHTGKKAFKTITSITTNATITGATVGEGVLIGLPYACAGKWDVISIYSTSTLDTTYTIAGAVTTDPATTSTGDVRGTISFASAPNGTLIQRVKYMVAGPGTTACFGVTQA